MRRNPYILDRRRFLAGLGLGAGSLFLPSLSLGGARAQSSTPTRVIFFITPHGTVPGRWHMRQSGRDREEYDIALGGLAESQFSDILRPLHRHREKLLILDGLARAVTFAEEYKRSGDLNRHHIAQAHLMTSTWAYQGASTARGGGLSIDQEIGNAIGQPGRWNSRVYGFSHQHEYTYVGANQPAPREQNAQTAFNEILGLVPEPTDPNAPPSRDDLIRAARASALDMASEEFAAVLPRLGATDREKLERHRSLVRDLEIGLASPPAPIVGCDPSFSTQGHAIDQFSRIITMALACDLTRVATLITQKIPSQEFGVDPGLDIHQDIAHESNEKIGTTAGIEGMVNYNRVYAEHFAYLLDQLDSVQEGSGSLLDNTAVVWLTELATGGHDLHRSPVVVAGGASGYFRTGRYLHFAEVDPITAEWGAKWDIGHAQERVFVNLMHAMGMTERQWFGLSEVQLGQKTLSLTGPLPNMT